VDRPTCPSSLGHRGHQWHRAVPCVGSVRLPGDEHYSLYDQVRATLPSDSYDSQALIRPRYSVVAPSEDDALMPPRRLLYFMRAMNRRARTIFICDRILIYLRTREHFSVIPPPCAVDRKSRYLPHGNLDPDPANNRRPSVKIKNKKSDHQLRSLSTRPSPRSFSSSLLRLTTDTIFPPPIMMHLKTLLIVAAALATTVSALPQVTRRGRYLYK